MQILDSLLQSSPQLREDDDNTTPNTLLSSLMPQTKKKSEGEKLAEKVWERTFSEKMPQLTSLGKQASGEV
jgi:hypothetical protein